MSSTPQIAADPRLIAVLRALLARRPGRVLLECAEVELVRLLRREQVALLGCAARLARELQHPLRELHDPLGELHDPLRELDYPLRELGPARREARWRRAASECAALCAADELPFARLLAVCLAEPVSSWPSPDALERAAERRRPGSTR